MKFQNLIPKLLSSANQKKVNVKNNLNQIFSREQFETKPSKFQYDIVRKLRNLLLECLLPYTHPIIYPIIQAVGFRTLANQTSLSFMTVCRHGFHNDVMAYMLQFG